MNPEIHLCRAYDARDGVQTVGARLLVDRLWPRGIAKVDLSVDQWLKDIAPSGACENGSDMTLQNGVNSGIATGLN